MKIFSYLVNADAATGVKSSVTVNRDKVVKGFMASVSAGTATVIIQVSNDNVVFADLVTLSPTLATVASSVQTCPWPYVRANVTATTGSAVVTVTIGN
jgi:hypothetical protein